MPSLRIEQNKNNAALVYDLHKPLTSLGSSSDCDITISDPLVPDVFANIRFDGQTYAISVVDKSAKLVINGKKRRRHKLSHGDKLGVGLAKISFNIVSPPKVAASQDSTPRAQENEIDAYRQLHKFSERLMRTENLPGLLEELMDAVVEITEADKGFLVLLEGDTPSVKVARNCRRDNVADAVDQLSDAIITRVIEKKTPIIVSDAMKHSVYATSLSVTRLKLTSVICVPLLDRGSLLGVLYVGKDSALELFQESTMIALSVFAAQASLILRSAMLFNQLRADNESLASSIDAMRFGSLVGSSPSMQAVFETVSKVATTDASVLITGETGTGKELIAREIHRRSDRSNRPFVVINCGAIPENLLESELFGHVRGAFTGAVKSKNGTFQAAHGGTLFLDEIGEMPVELQAKILRVLQERVVTKVGDTKSEPIDIRVISATNRDLAKEITRGSFREDLFYRLNVIPITLPPLRARGDDVIALARYFLHRAQQDLEVALQGFTSDADRALRKHSWPGNIRELENRIKKAAILATSPLLCADDLSLGDSVLDTVLPLAEAKEKFQRDYINNVLDQNAGNRAKTARDLGVDPRTIFRHLEKGSEI